ncbi:hypothetical protein HANVADRAFT_68919 [Hanseniaspora valbyensis NRRL Y-1626]|uniref:Uncharacterized protein n=1 Tax=Hanseniaspora valbyensis NRRL Y-1626 TaxID=766949 RepID=A0A1B7TEU9_9ASCO|nr:hypothetical protein HANVADRAFT_68919 [Hanseniaspora valbyensis NRRL Y-1626]
MSFNFNSNNTSGGNKNLSIHESLAYKPLTVVLNKTLYPDFPIVPYNKDILQLLTLNYFDNKNINIETLINKEKILVTDYNICMNILSLNETVKDDLFDIFFVFTCNKDIDPLLIKHIPIMVSNKQKQSYSELKNDNKYKLIQLPYNSFSTINKNGKIAPYGVFILRFTSKDNTLSKNSLYINIINKVPDI